MGFQPRILQQPRIEHAIARYPLSAADVLSSFETASERLFDTGLSESNPEAFRALLFAYASETLDESPELSDGPHYQEVFEQ